MAMGNSKARNIGFLVVSTTLGAIGQLLFKYSLQQLAATYIFALWMSAGIIAYLASTVVYFYVLSRVHLSLAYTIGGMGYVIAIVLAAVVLGEPVSALRWAGILVITLGVVLIGLS